MFSGLFGHGHWHAFLGTHDYKDALKVVGSKINWWHITAKPDKARTVCTILNAPKTSHKWTHWSHILSNILLALDTFIERYMSINVLIVNKLLLKGSQWRHNFSLYDSPFDAK